MGAADAAFVLWSEYLHFDPKDPQWPGRDRFVLSAGHACMLQYALLHLFGFDLPLEQWNNSASGEPHAGAPRARRHGGGRGHDGAARPGVGNAIGMAIAAKMLGSRLNGADGGPFSGRVYAIVSDGDMMEGSRRRRPRSPATSASRT